MPKITAYKNTTFSIKSLLQDKIFLSVVKIVCIALLLYILYQQLFGREDLTLHGLLVLLQHKTTTQNLPLLLFVLVLMPLNWLFETHKWQLLLQKIQKTALLPALKAILTGVTVSLFTPNRVGEYGGRILLVNPDKRYLAAYASLVGILSQWLVLLLGGWWAMMAAFSLQLLPIGTATFGLLVVIGILLTTFLLLSYYRFPWFVKRLGQYRWAKKWTSKLPKTAIPYYSSIELHRILWQSFLRYSTYSFQYFLLLYFFGLPLDYFAALLGIFIVYLLQTGIPLPPSTGLLARGNIALFIFGYLSPATTTVAPIILAATLSLWIINVLLPALAGGLFLWQYKRTD